MDDRQPKSKSERLFAAYLRGIRVGYDYEPLVGTKRPDYALKDSTGDYLALVEIEDLARPADWVENKVRGVKSYKPIREKINVAREQLKFGKHLPCMLVLYARDDSHPLGHRHVLGAMFGNITIQVPLAVFGPEDVDGKERLVYGRGGKMRIPKHTGEPQNTSISAVGVLEEVAVDQFRSGYLAELDARTKALPARDLNALYEAVGAVTDELRAKYGARGVDFQRVRPRLRIYRNPYARIPWPDHLVSEADEVWALDEQQAVMARVYDGLAPVAQA